MIEETDYTPLIADEGDPSVTWEQVQSLLAKLPGSLSDDFDRERDERFLMQSAANGAKSI